MALHLLSPPHRPLISARRFGDLDNGRKAIFPLAVDPPSHLERVGDREPRFEPALPAWHPIAVRRGFIGRSAFDRKIILNRALEW
jgi:hypothetical protein